MLKKVRDSDTKIIISIVLDSFYEEAYIIKSNITQIGIYIAILIDFVKPLNTVRNFTPDRNIYIFSIKELILLFNHSRIYSE